MDETAQTGMLTLGWQLNNRLEPIYWLNKKAKAGGHSEEHLVRVPADMLAYHTAIVAQSGSGKSFFLGRLIEEIMLSTKARCVVLDPNADFRRVSEVVDTVRWKKAAYEKGRGHLPHEETAQKFIDEWKKIDVRVRVGPALGEGNYTRFKLPWMSLSVEIFSDDVDPTLRIELYHCHEFVRAVASLLLRKSAEIDIIDEAERIFDRIRDEPPRYRRHALEEEFGQTAGSRNPLLGGLLFLNIFGYRRSIDRAAAALGYVSPDTKRYYFGKAREYVAQTS